MPKKTQTPQITLQADNDKQHLDIYLIGIIGDWWDDITANRVLQQLRSYKNLQTITVHLSTIGGGFYDGLPMYNLLDQHSAHVTFNIIGYSVSMGTHLMMSADEIHAAQNSIFMIHNAQGGAYGSHHDLRKYAEVMQKHEEAIIGRYCERMSLDKEEVQALLDAETWYTADEALEAGLIDKIVNPVDLEDVDNKLPDNSWQYATENFKHPPTAFVQRIENAMDKQKPWVMKMLDKAVGKSTTIINQPSDDIADDEDEEMTPEQLEELKAAMKEDREETVKILVAALQPGLDETSNQGGAEGDGAGDTVSQGDHDAVVADLKNQQKENEKLKAELAELKEEQSGTETPENTGPAGEGFAGMEYEG